VPQLVKYFYDNVIVYGLFNDIFTGSDYVQANDRMIAE
jgi:hypothetical protein